MRKSRFFAFWRQTDRRTDEQMDITDALSRSRYRERRLNKTHTHTHTNTGHIATN